MKEKILVIVLVLFNSCSAKQESAKQESMELVGRPSRYDSLFEITCRHTSLSRDFDVEVYVKRHIDTKTKDDSCVVKLLLWDKATGQRVDSIFMTTLFYYDDVFRDCQQVRSYITQFNADKIVVDNDYGNLVLADLNFDDKEDIAVINDSGGNGGVFYSYYLQDKDRRFVLSRYLTDSMIFFPEINREERTLTTYVHAGVCAMGEHIYRLDKADGNWRQESHRVIDVCK